MVDTKVKKKLTWNFRKPTQLLKFEGLATVCEESRCPNRNECSSAGIATFMIGGATCTRACQFCHIATGRPGDLAAIIEKETQQVLTACEDYNLNYAVITSVARDDDEALLAGHFANLTQELNHRGIEVELLIPDFHLRNEHLSVIGEAAPLVLAHNVETIKRLSKKIRPQADYQRSLGIFDYFKAKYPGVILKTGFMVGLGENFNEIENLLVDIKNHHVDIVTIGQYMQPSSRQALVEHTYSEQDFARIETLVKEAGFLGYEVGPFVRSSYMASRTMQMVKEAKKLPDK